MNETKPPTNPSAPDQQKPAVAAPIPQPAQQPGVAALKDAPLKDAPKTNA